jgi:hypothetical protein
MLTLIHYVNRGGPEHRMAVTIFPVHHAELVRPADVHANAGELPRTSELRCINESSGS